MIMFPKISVLLLLLCSAASLAAAPPDYNAFEYLEYLEGGELSDLNESLKSIQKGYERGEYDDRAVAAAFSVFSNSNRAYEKALTQWVEQYPDAYAARLARGVYYVHLGFLSRGGRFSDQTAESRFVDMRQWFDEASDDLMAALELNPRLTVAYRHLMRISMAGGSRDATEKLFQQGMDVDPASYTVWNGYLFSLQPKWGGSMTELGAAIRKMNRQFKKSPALETLSGYMQYTLGNQEDVFDDNNKGALYYYDKAVAKGDHEWFLLGRGKAHYKLSQYNAALDDFDRLLSFRPFHDEAYYWRAKTHRKLENREAAMNDFDKAVKLDYSDPDIRRNRGLLYWSLSQWGKAVEDFSEALVFGGDKANHWEYRGRMLLKQKKYQKAADDLVRAAELDPGDEDHWYYLAVSQHHLRDCGIIDTLSRYSALCADNDCPGERVAWANKTLKGFEARGICS